MPTEEECQKNSEHQQKSKSQQLNHQKSGMSKIMVNWEWKFEWQAELKFKRNPIASRKNFCEGFYGLMAKEMKNQYQYRFINLEILNNIRITNVGF